MIELSFFLCTFFLYMSIYSTNILSVGLSVRLQKAKELGYLWMLLTKAFSFNFSTNSKKCFPQHFDYHKDLQNQWSLKVVSVCSLIVCLSVRLFIVQLFLYGYNQKIIFFCSKGIFFQGKIICLHIFLRK